MPNATRRARAQRRLRRRGKLADVKGRARRSRGRCCSTALWTAAHALSHPPAFLGAVAAAGLLLALWRWACRDLVGPVIGHVVADLAL